MEWKVARVPRKAKKIYLFVGGLSVGSSPAPDAHTLTMEERTRRESIFIVFELKLAF